MPTSIDRITPSDCSPFDPSNPPNYGYTPSLAAGIAFIVLFGTLTTAHLALTILSRRWWQLLFVLGGLGELLGWIARTWASQCVYSAMAFKIQISCLIFSPAFFAAGIYVVLGHFIKVFGAHTSPLSAKQYLWIFCSVDGATLTLQAIGGGLASAAGDKPDGNIKPGTDVMIVGIVFQLAANVVFAGFFARVLYKTYRPGGKGILNVDHLPLSPSSSPSKARPATTTTTHLRFLAAATAVSTAALIARGIYRSVELIQGWRGYLITTERYFIGLDGALMVVTGVVFVVANPHYLLPREVECMPGSGLEDGGVARGRKGMGGVGFESGGSS
ncbi:MAG: hypothetical protein Q9203_001191 [Teloschistes exilis]